MIGTWWVFIVKQVSCNFCTALHLSVAVSLVAEMHQTASKVTEVESFLKKPFEALPVGMDELPTTALIEPTQIIRLSSAQQTTALLCNLLFYPCNSHAHTQLECMCLWTHWGTNTMQYTVYTHILIQYLCSQFINKTAKGNNSNNSMTRAIIVIVFWKYSSDSVGMMRNKSLTILWTESWK